VKGRRLAVLTAEDWEAMVEWLETVEDVQAAQQAFEHLKAAGGDRKQAGWLEWKEAEEEVILAILNAGRCAKSSKTPSPGGRNHSPRPEREIPDPV